MGQINRENTDGGLVRTNGGKKDGLAWAFSKASGG
jgi:hypothetical protein